MQLINAFFWSNSNSKLFYFSSIWIIFEFLRSVLFTGLPWNLVGYSWSWSLSYSQSASIFGIYGLGLITVFCSVCIFSYIADIKNKFFEIETDSFTLYRVFVTILKSEKSKAKVKYKLKIRGELNL